MTIYVCAVRFVVYSKVLNMFSNLKQVFIIISIVICNGCKSASDFMTINWNISTDRGHSDSERDYKYPMYHDVAPVPCDLTSSCDPFCCEDPDCEDHQVTQCPKPSSNCNGFLSFFDCNCDNFDKPEWLSVFCFVYKNPIYLGKFFETPKKIEKSSTLKSVVQRNSRFPYGRNREAEFKAKTSNALGSAVMTFVPGSSSFPSVNQLLRKTPLKDSTYACLHSSVKYRINSKATCLVRVNQELCQNGHTLGSFPYLVQSSNSTVRSNIPFVLKNPDFLEGLKTEVVIKCVKLKTKTMKFKQKIMYLFEEDSAEDCPDFLKSYQTLFTNNTCQNTLAFVNYQFTVNGSDPLELKAEYGLTNLSLLIENNNSLNDNVIHKYIYLKQKFHVHFYDIMNKSYDSANHSRHDGIYNRGYFIGEELNFGYRLTRNSTTSWEKGILGVFGNGGSCDSLSPVAFGFHIFSVCYIRQRFPNCTQLRRTIEGKFEALLRGDSLAAYANLRPPYADTVPLLRNFRNSSPEESSNATQCLVPVAQEVLVQYTSLPTDCGLLIHRVLGARVDRVFRNVSADDDVELSTRVFFFFVSSSREKPLSRFWRKMYSQELSDNSWLNLLNAFDDVDCNERKEIAFWCSVFALFGAAMVVLTKNPFNLQLGEFLQLFSLLVPVLIVDLMELVILCKAIGEIINAGRVCPIT